MKIAFLVRKFPFLSQTFVLNQILGMVSRGYEVHIFALEGKDENADKVQPAVEKYCLLHRTYYPPTIPKNRLWRMLKGLGLLLSNLKRGSLACLQLLNFFKYGEQAYSLRLFYKAIPLLGNEPYDIIHCQVALLGPVGLLFRNLGILKGKKLITSVRGYDMSGYVKKQGDHVYDQLFAEGDLFLANSKFFRSLAIDLGCDAQKILVHGSGIDCHKFAFTPRYFPTDGRVRIVTTGRLVPKKGIEYGIRAIAKLVKVYPNIEYNIIGDGHLREDLQKLIQKLNVSYTVKLLGWKHQQEIIEILDNSHIFIGPSVTASSGDREGIPNVLKEAMAMGLPVVSTQHSGIPELVEDGISGFLVPERDADAIAEKICHLIEHREIWSEMGRAGRERVKEKYDMNKLNDELAQIYQQLLNSEVPQQQLSEQLVALSKKE